MDLAVIRDVVTILASVGTLLVAIIAFYNSRNTRRQLKLMEKQVILQRSELNPFLEILTKKIENGRITLELRNRGKGPAILIALETRFQPLRIDSSQWDFVSEIYEFANQRKRRIYLGTGIIPLKNAYGKAILYSDETNNFSGELKFLYKYSKSRESSEFKFDSFQELSDLLGANGIRFSAIVLNMVYKDISESVIESESLYFAVLDIKKHKSMADVIADKEPLPLPPSSISLEDVPCIDEELYKNLRSNRAFAGDHMP
jgi:hypothetical protein